jgi:outer membrane protein assembly factor BamB
LTATSSGGRLAWRTPGSAGPRPYAASSGAVFGFTVTRGGATDVGATSAASGTTENNTAGQPTVRALDARTGRRGQRAVPGQRPDADRPGAHDRSARWSYQLGAAVADVIAGGNAVYALDAHGGVYALRT